MLLSIPSGASDCLFANKINFYRIASFIYSLCQHISQWSYAPFLPTTIEQTSQIFMAPPAAWCVQEYEK
jgi:hypothetical protein